MPRTLFAQDWTVRRLPDGTPAPVTLPHDAMIGEPRSATAPAGFHGAFFPGGKYLYEKRWDVPEVLSEQINLFFEGVYGATTVRLNGTVIGESVSPYREFRVSLTDAVVAGEKNLLQVEVDNTAVPNSRWYTGSGIYRPVWLESSAAVHPVADGIHAELRTDPGPALAVHVDVQNPSSRPIRVTAELRDADGVIAATATGPNGRLQLAVPDAHLWSAEDPYLYTLDVCLQADDQIIDTAQLRTGLRTVELDAARGLRINGNEVKLRGAAIHHDNGVLGAATHRAAEYRRARILKAHGFNAIRSAHNPLSRDMLDACDEVGLYVVDELTDYWHEAKCEHDLAARFDELWPEDARSMVVKDRNHPCVIMYSIGNEIGETATPEGVNTSRRLHDAFKALDPYRPTTLAVSFLVNVMVSMGKPFGVNKAAADQPVGTKKPSKVSSTLANTIANKFGGIMLMVARLPVADKSSRDAFATVDAAGYNYGWTRYAGDTKRHPNRVIYGSESLPGEINKIWPLVQKHPSVIGDFMWTGWDYLGEAGVGTWRYGEHTQPMSFPLLTGGCGAIDITGIAGAPALLAQTTWGQFDAPRIAVRPLNRAGAKVHKSAWRSTDAVESWAWHGAAGKRAEIEVYSSAEQVELFLNSRSLGRKPAGARTGFVARFRADYEPGELVAVAYRRGQATSQSSLRSANEPTLVVRPETTSLAADGLDLAFVRIELADADGTVEMLADEPVTVTVTGPGELVGLGSGSPVSHETFTSDTHTTYQGRCLAVIRATTEPGVITVTATSARHGTTSASVTVERG